MFLNESAQNPYQEVRQPLMTPESMTTSPSSHSAQVSSSHQARNSSKLSFRVGACTSPNRLHPTKQFTAGAKVLSTRRITSLKPLPSQPTMGSAIGFVTEAFGKLAALAPRA